MDDPNITKENTIMIEEEKARRHGKVFNWETAKYGKIWDNEDVHDLGSVETEFLAIVFDDAFTSKVTHSCEPTPTVSYFDDLDYFKDFDKEFPAIVYNDALTSKLDFLTEPTDKDNDDDKVDIKHSLGDLSVKPLPDVITTDVGAYAHGSNKLLETSHDTSNKFFKTETFIKELNFNIMTWNHLNKGMSFIILIKNRYQYGVSWGMDTAYRLPVQF
ncbi:hypothetical protein Tco_1379260 [Tanacetum coccineum]